jgi:fumarylpyruvate hydrolase
MDTVFPASPAPFVPVRGTDAVFPVRHIWCTGYNYTSHNVEMGRVEDIKPVFFSKPGDAVVWADARRCNFGRGDTPAQIPYAQATLNFHYEVELVVAIGKAGKNLSIADAPGLIYGYAVGLDLTRRDLQNDAKENGSPWDMAKGFDHSAPIGDIVRAVDVKLAEQARIWLTLNDETKQDSDLSRMIVKVPEIIATLSRFVELKPGDLIYTGTPDGVGPLAAGDTVKAGIAGLGEVILGITP